MLTLPGLCQIIREEAIVLTTYDDGGKIANGIGNRDDSLVPGSMITIEEAIKTFLFNMTRFEAVVDRSFTRTLLPNQRDAMGSRAFNSGVTGFTRLTGLIKAVEDDNKRMVIYELCRGGNLKRRLHEASMYCFAEYKDPECRLYEGDPRTTPYRIIKIPQELLVA